MFGFELGDKVMPLESRPNTPAGKVIGFIGSKVVVSIASGAWVMEFFPTTLVKVA